MRVVVLSGGRSSEHEVSLRSGVSVAGGLAAAGHEVVPVRIERDGRWMRDGSEIDLIPAAGVLDADAVFPVLHGPNGEDGTVQGLLECLDVPYVGAGVLASAICIDKLTFKRLLDYHHVPQVRFCAVGEEGWRDLVASFGLPVWVKPSRLGSSVGISKVLGPERELDEAIDAALRHDPRVIVEAGASGKEVECSVVGNDEPQTSVPGEIVAHADWYDYEAKYSEGGMELVVPPRIDAGTRERVRELAARVYGIVGCTGMARCDFFVTDEGEVLVNELNTIPGFTETSVFGKLFEATGVSYPELCDRLVQLAVERHERERAFRF
ncbi:MAG TPA: D-alanine--D-alanine ligase family protein [Solirubrobacterales bacterium]|jgi:D-alanine-D-alanine ligase|nr:D-alanine--D-alanine ligase family protein [Solirubrobacterales bacterium]